MLILKMFGNNVVGETSMESSRMLDVILNRTSIRNFERGKNVPKEILQKILDAGIRAPSAGNIQPRTVIVVNDDSVKERLYALCEEQAFMKDAPVWIVICVDLHRHLRASKLSGVEYDYTGILPFTFGVLDAALSLENMVITAEALDLGSVIIGSVIEHPETVKEILQLPEHCLALSILCIGYPKGRPVHPRQKWDSKVIACEDYYADIDSEAVLKCWRKFAISDFERSGKQVKEEVIQTFLRENGYGKTYANHYKEEFIRATNQKLMQFLKEHGFL